METPTQTLIDPTRKAPTLSYVNVMRVRKAIGPVAFSSIFASSLRTWGWEGHSLVFCILAAFSVMQIICVLCLPSYVEHGRDPEPKEATLKGVEERRQDSEANSVDLESKA